MKLLAQDASVGLWQKCSTLDKYRSNINLE